MSCIAGQRHSLGPEGRGRLVKIRTVFVKESAGPPSLVQLIITEHLQCATPRARSRGDPKVTLNVDSLIGTAGNLEGLPRRPRAPELSFAAVPSLSSSIPAATPPLLFRVADGGTHEAKKGEEL